MFLTIDASIFEKFPHVKLGALVINGINNTGTHAEIARRLREEERSLRERHDLESLSTDPKITDWRTAYRTFGFKPSSYRSSVEALIRRVLKGDELPTISPVVDIYNTISIKHTLPIGGDDIDHVEGGITLTIAGGTERFLMLGTDAPTPIKEGEVVYRDASEVLCRAWNYRECDKSKITEKTQNTCLVIEGLEHTTKGEIQAALSELKNLLETYCKGTYQAFLLDQESPKITF